MKYLLPNHLSDCWPWEMISAADNGSYTKSSVRVKLHRCFVAIGSLIVVLAVGLCTTKVAIAQDVILPPNTSEGVFPWVVGFSTPPSVINVKITNSTGDPWPGFNPNFPYYFNVNMESYVWGVVIGELGGPPPGYSSWHGEAVKAQSIAARTYGSYRAKVVTEPSFVGITNGPEHQVYRPYRLDVPDTIKTSYAALIQWYRGQYLAYSNPVTQRYKYNLIDSLYGADNTNPTMGYWNMGYGYLPRVGNPYSTGLYSIQGMPQLGSQGIAANGSILGKQATTFWQILSHFYPGTHLVNSQPMWTVNTYAGRTSSGCNTGSQLNVTTTKWINYDWGTTSLGILNDGKDPNSSIPSDHICMHFSAWDSFATDWYTFYVIADDGFKLLIDGVEVLSKWQVGSPRMYSVNVPMTAGSHQIMLKYFEDTGGAVARLFYRRWNGMVGSYYNRVITEYETPSGNGLVWQRPDPTISFHWQNMSPLDTNADTTTPQYPRIPVDQFSVIWDSHLYIPPGSARVVTFDIVHDDGMVLEINTGGGYQAAYRNWGNSGSSIISIGLNPGIYPLRIRYREGGWLAIVRVTWQ